MLNFFSHISTITFGLGSSDLQGHWSFSLLSSCIWFWCRHFVGKYWGAAK